MIKKIQNISGRKSEVTIELGVSYTTQLLSDPVGNHTVSLDSIY